MARKYGMPYKGSKNAIAEKLIEVLPPAEHFYDLFGGGGAMTHCALLSGKYKYVHYNELDPLVFEGFKMAVNGEFKNENRWISREDFERLKDSDPYVAICFSFGNDLRTYCYSKEKEPFKRAVHNFLFFNNKSDIERYVPIDIEFTSDDVNTKRLEFQRYIKTYKEKVKPYYDTDGMNIVHHCSALARLQSLERLGRLQRLERLDYSEVQIEDNSLIYCDIPYNETNQYKTEFDHERFYKWAEQQDNIFISEYEMPDNFIELYSFKRHITMSANKKSHGKNERLFTNRKTFELLNCNNNVLW